MNQPSIYTLPHIASLMEAERNETDPVRRAQIHYVLCSAIKVEQIKRGQRTKWTYRKGA